MNWSSHCGCAVGTVDSSVVAGFLGAFLTLSWDLACPLRTFFRGSLHTTIHTSTCSCRINWLVSSLASQLLCSWSGMSCLVSATAAPPQLAALLREAAVLAVSKKGLFPSASSCKACSLAFGKELHPRWYAGGAGYREPPGYSTATALPWQGKKGWRRENYVADIWCVAWYVAGSCWATLVIKIVSKPAR